jgi:hypothetical protein
MENGKKIERLTRIGIYVVVVVSIWINFQSREKMVIKPKGELRESISDCVSEKKSSFFKNPKDSSGDKINLTLVSDKNIAVRD